ncbi:MAG: hypothetical protein JXR07_19120 [Reichenbachiella sp.]
MSKHYCMGRMKSIAFFEKAHDCMQINGLESEDIPPMECCDDVEEELKIKDYSKTKFDFQIRSILVLNSVIPLVVECLQIEPFELAFYTKYIPPLINQNIPILNQQFLI